MMQEIYLDAVDSRGCSGNINAVAIDSPLNDAILYQDQPNNLADDLNTCVKIGSIRCGAAARKFRVTAFGEEIEDKRFTCTANTIEEVSYTNGSFGLRGILPIDS